MPLTNQPQSQSQYAEDNENEKNKSTITWSTQYDTKKQTHLSSDEIQHLENLIKDPIWKKSDDLSQKIGKTLFDILDGDERTLKRALKEADEQGETLQLYVKSGYLASKLPFELLYDSIYLVPSRIHLVRKVSDRGNKRKPTPEGHPLKILFMACSPRDTHPILNFEKEEEKIFKVTKKLAVEMDVEDTGSLEGLSERLAVNNYDIVHITGCAGIHQGGGVW